ncbi:MAG: hypothetical protein JWR16_3003 [Nevskia sp.]|nr:hypothetical protein [Nevskia sp.]
MTMKSDLLNLVALLGGVLLAAAVQAQGSAPSAAGDTTALFAQGRGDEAMRALETQVGTNPFDPVAMNNLAAVKAARQDWNAAAALLVRAHRLAPNNAIIGANLDHLNAWLARSTPSDVKAKPVAGDQLGELAQIPPEPPELWAAPKTSAAGAQPKQPTR